MAEFIARALFIRHPKGRCDPHAKTNIRKCYVDDHFALHECHATTALVEMHQRSIGVVVAGVVVVVGSGCAHAVVLCVASAGPVRLRVCVYVGVLFGTLYSTSLRLSILL